MPSRILSIQVIALLLIAGGLCAGCGESQPAVVEKEIEAETPVEPVTTAAETDNAQQEPEEAAVARKKVAYTPPFPDRETLFEPPKQAKRSSLMEDDLPNGGVLLLGFANVDSEKAVLSIDGVVTPLASGGEYAGVRVISLAPPKVVLQRGRSRWTESIQ